MLFREREERRRRVSWVCAKGVDFERRGRTARRAHVNVTPISNEKYLSSNKGTLDIVPTFQRCLALLALAVLLLLGSSTVRPLFAQKPTPARAVRMCQRTARQPTNLKAVRSTMNKSSNSSEFPPGSLASLFACAPTQNTKHNQRTCGSA